MPRKRILYLLAVLAMVMSLLPVAAVAQDIKPTDVTSTGADQAVEKTPPTEREQLDDGPGLARPVGVAGVGTDYGWSQTTGAYTEITGGTVQCTPGSGNTYCDDVNVNNVAIGFAFTFNGTAYTAVGLNTNGFVRMGSTAFTTHCGYTPISSSDATCVNLISGLGEDQQGNTTGAELRTETLGTSPNQVFVIQYKNWRHYSATSESYNYQIRLYETTNLVEVVYGPFTKNATNRTDQIGLKGAANTDFNNRSGTGAWTASVAGALNTATMALTSTYTPPSGLTWDWTPISPHPIFDTSYKTAPAKAVVGDPLAYVVHIVNSGTAVAGQATLLDPIPAGATYVPGTVSCSLGACGFDGTNVTWGGSVAVAGEVTVSFSVDTDGLPCGGVVVNQATLNDPGLFGGAVVKSASTTLVASAPTPLEGFETSVPPPGWTETIVVDPGTDPDWTRESAGTYPTDRAARRDLHGQIQLLQPERRPGPLVDRCAGFERLCRASGRLLDVARHRLHDQRRPDPGPGLDRWRHLGGRGRGRAAL